MDDAVTGPAGLQLLLLAAGTQQELLARAAALQARLAADDGAAGWAAAAASGTTGAAVLGAGALDGRQLDEDKAGAALAGAGRHRLALWADSASAAAWRLAVYLAGEPADGLVSGVAPSPPSQVAFLCTGQGAQYPGMGQALYAAEPVFRAALDACHHGLLPYLSVPLRQVLFPAETGDAAAALVHETTYTQPALFAIEYALAQLWQSWGVVPDAVMGHSAGEYVAATLAGVFSLADGLKLIAARGRLMGALPPGGSMAAVFADAARVQAALAPYAETVSVAAVNGPTQTVISGAEPAVAAVLAALKAERVRARPLVVSHAFHSPLMEPMLDEFEAIAATVAYNPPRIPLFSNVTGRRAEAEAVTHPRYWRDHVRAAVLFAPAAAALADAGLGIFLEIGPQPHLVGMARRMPFPAGAEPLFLPSLQAGEPDRAQLLASRAALFVHGR